MAYKDVYKDIKNMLNKYRKETYWDIFGPENQFYIATTREALFSFTNDDMSSSFGIQLFYTSEGLNYLHDRLTTHYDGVVTIDDCDALFIKIVDKDNITNGVTLKPLSILYENIDEVDNKIYYIQVININEVVYSVVKLCDKTKNEEIVRVLIIEDNSIFDLKGNNLKEYFNKNNLEINKKIIEYAKSVYFNENVFSLIDSFSRIISLY
jgi:hypothetical protein